VTTIHHPVTGDDPLSGNKGLLHVEVGAAVADKDIEFMKAPRVEEQIKPLPCC
jgi:hypothetical protein